MGNDRSWKLDKTLKIDDDQLKTPEHDKICLWVHKNHLKIIKMHIPKLKIYSTIRSQRIANCKNYINLYKIH